MAGSSLIEQFHVDLSEIEMVQRLKSGETFSLNEQHTILNQMLDVAEIQLTRRMGLVKTTDAEFAAWLGVSPSALSRWRKKPKKFETALVPDLPNIINCVTLSKVFGPIIFDLRGYPRLYEPRNEVEGAILSSLSTLSSEGMAAAAKFIKELANGYKATERNGGMEKVRGRRKGKTDSEVRGHDAGEQ